MPDIVDIRQNLRSWVRALAEYTSQPRSVVQRTVLGCQRLLGCQECNPGYDYTMTTDELSFG